MAMIYVIVFWVYDALLAGVFDDNSYLSTWND